MSHSGTVLLRTPRLILRKFDRIEAKHDSNNPGSGRVMQKCGMQYEGIRLAAGFNNLGVCDFVLYGAVKHKREYKK